MGWGVFALSAGLITLQRQYAAHGSRAQMLGRTAAIVWPVAVPLILMLVWRQEGGLPTVYIEDVVRDKIQHLAAMLRDQSQLLDFTTLGFCILALFWLLREKIAIFNPSMLWVSLGLWATYIVMPSCVFGSYFADARLIHVAAILTFTGLKWQHPSRTLMSGVAVVACLLFASRMGVTTLTWNRKNTQMQQHLTALEFIPRGARILALVPLRCTQLTWDTQYQYKHLSDMSIVRRDAFVNTLWRMPGAQSLTLKYNLDTRYHSDPSQYVAEDGCANLAPNITHALRDFPRDRFDFVWMLDLAGSTRIMPKDLHLLYRDPQTALYKINRQSPAPAAR
jgi:hypothetical protein